MAGRSGVRFYDATHLHISVPVGVPHLLEPPGPHRGPFSKSALHGLWFDLKARQDKAEFKAALAETLSDLIPA